MGTHALDAINMAIDHEDEWDEYASGSMPDFAALEAGILSHDGYVDSIQLERAVARNPIPTWDTVHDQLKNAERDLELSTLRSSACTPSRGSMQKVLNANAISNLNKSRPTCNWCGEMMQPRTGTYGKFYYCDCPEQCTVSDKYWQSIRKHKPSEEKRMSKHTHAELIKAKINDMTLVVFIKSKEWFSLSEITLPSNSANEYFLCLPQHEKACKHWLNGGGVQDFFENEWTDCPLLSETINTDSDNSLKFSYHHMFMNEEFHFRIKPEPQKRWIVYSPKFEYAKKELFEHEPDLNKFGKHFRSIEIEIEECDG